RSPVWLTAVMILVAGTPRSICACKPQALTPPAAGTKASSTCCCGNSCPTGSATEGHTAKMCPCCQAKSAKAPTTSASSIPCKRVTGPTPVFALTKSEQQASEATSSLAHCQCANAQAPWANPALAIEGDLLIHPALPPTDLITLHQHFTI